MPASGVNRLCGLLGFVGQLVGDGRPVCVNVLDHTWKPPDVVREVRRVLRPGGLFFLGVDVYPPEIAAGAIDDIHLWSLTSDTVTHMVTDASFTIHENRLCPSSMPTEKSKWFWLVATAR